ncbi:hypothetical protein LguiB_021419 [Lonicera macranthoides]
MTLSDEVKWALTGIVSVEKVNAEITCFSIVFILAGYGRKFFVEWDSSIPVETGVQRKEHLCREGYARFKKRFGSRKSGENKEKEGDKGGDKKDKDSIGDKKEEESGGGGGGGGGKKEKKMEYYGYNPNTYTIPVYHQSDKKEKESSGGGGRTENKLEYHGYNPNTNMMPVYHQSENKEKESGGGGGKKENKMEYYGYNPNTYTIPVYHQSYLAHGQNYFNHGYTMDYSHSPSGGEPSFYHHTMFSDESPNACSVM